MFNNGFFFENSAVYEIIWKNMEQPDRPQMTYPKSICFACRITKSKKVHSKHVIRNALPWQELLRERASI